ncbi:MAG: GTP-binding protein, partial [Longimicrobiales bacterium]
MRSAREYPTEKIRNVAVLGHGGSGKTSLVDALCFTAGTSQRRGNVEDGHAVTLTAPEEVSHGISIQLTPAFAEWREHKINLLDTPGYLDFTGEALSAVRVSEGAVVVVDATAGVEVGTEKVWSYCEERGIPRIIFISKMDKENADFDGVFSEIRSRLTSAAIPVEIPIGSGEDFRGIINLISEKALLYKDGTETGEFEEVE